MSPWKPRPAAGADVRSLNLSPQEGYVLSRVDGATDVEGIAQITGVPEEEARAILERLVRAGALEPPPAEEAPAADPDAGGERHRERFERRLHPLPEDTRASLALAAAEPDLSAFCFDPAPAVIRRVLDNPRAGLPHARLVAAHHGNPVGLGALAARASFLGDAVVQRLLLRNNQTPDALVRRFLSGRRLVDIHNAGRSREVAERHRRTARDLLRRRFATGSPEERVEVIVETEGRVLSSLAGVSLDARPWASCARGVSPPPSSSTTSPAGRRRLRNSWRTCSSRRSPARCRPCGRC